MTCPACKCETYMTICPQCGINVNKFRLEQSCKNVELTYDEPLEGHLSFQHMPSLRLYFTLEDCDNELAQEQATEIKSLVKLMNQYYATKNGG